MKFGKVMNSLSPILSLNITQVQYSFWLKYNKFDSEKNLQNKNPE